MPSHNTGSKLATEAIWINTACIRYRDPAAQSFLENCLIGSSYVRVLTASILLFSLDETENLHIPSPSLLQLVHISSGGSGLA